MSPEPTSQHTTAPAQWQDVGAADDFPPGKLATFKQAHRQLVIGRRADGAFFALDNRCPHEGYPLAQGDLKDCSLTCAWHNWKFDVRDGHCTLGGEDVRAYPVRVQGDRLEVDVAEPTLAAILPTLQRRLGRALFHRDVSWALRDAARLLHAGYDARQLLADVARYDALHAEYGTTHVLPVAADCGRLLERFSGPDALYPVALAIDLCAESNVRLAPRKLPRPRAGANLQALRDAVEAEDADAAEGMLRGAFQAGTNPRDIERWLYAILADHFLDFGHPLIYMVKAGELLARVDSSYAIDVYAGLLYGAVLATREDRLPYMRGYFRTLPDADALARQAVATRPDAPFDHATTRDTLLDGSAREAVQCVWSALENGVAPGRLAGALVAAAAQRLWRFDARWDDDPDVAENWLWATHRLTFASAVRQALERFESPAAWRYVIQAAAFVHSGRRMDAPAGRRPNVAATVDVGAAPPGDDNAHIGAAVAAIAARQSDDAVRAAGAALAAGKANVLRQALEDLCLRDPAVRPIFVAHALKTTIAAFDEHEALEGLPERDVPVLAAVRFLASPMQERRVVTSVRTALRWVVDGVMPRKLTQ